MAASRQLLDDTDWWEEVGSGEVLATWLHVDLVDLRAAEGRLEGRGGTTVAVWGDADVDSGGAGGLAVLLKGWVVLRTLVGGDRVCWDVRVTV